MRVLALGAGGMLGSAVARVLGESNHFEVWGSVRSTAVRDFPVGVPGERVLRGVDVLHQDSLIEVLNRVRPDVVVNCIGIVKQLAEASDPLVALPINALLPHRLARLCEMMSARLVHVSTDCVFSGMQGSYRESDFADADDLYGRSKYLGELAYSHTITLRTSIIGHELNSAHGVVDWFLSQERSVRGYMRAIFSGLPTVELARIIRDYVLPHPELSGIYHVASEPIAKHDLLRLVARIYGKSIEIVPDYEVVIDRSLNAERFREVTGYRPPEWEQLVRIMYESR